MVDLSRAELYQLEYDMSIIPCHRALLMSLRQIPNSLYSYLT